MYKKTIPLLLACYGLMSLLACREAPTNLSDKNKAVAPSGIVVEAESFSNAEGAFATQDLPQGGQQVMAPGEAGWLAYTVAVPQAGRYRVEVQAKSAADTTGTLWLEYHTDNTDGRTFDATGKMPVIAADEFQTVSKDGTPFRQGTHQIKLHVDGGVNAIDWIKLTLLRPYKKTPQTLTQRTEGDSWELVWSDEFEQDGSPDTSKWTYDLGDWGWGNNERQYYTQNRPENARVENGNLIIEALKNDMGKAWTSARLTTRGKVSFLYGKIEFRAKVPVEKGNWAAGWTLGDEYVDELSWPYCGEIDILETVGYELDNESGDGKAHASVHSPDYYFKINTQITAVQDVADMHDSFHTYAIEWTPAGILGFVDDQHYFTYDKTNGEREWPFYKPQNIILNLAMGGGWGGARGMDDTVTRQQFVIDYVRVFEKR